MFNIVTNSFGSKLRMLDFGPTKVLDDIRFIGQTDIKVWDF
jgi:hypothetical protein